MEKVRDCHQMLVGSDDVRTGFPWMREPQLTNSQEA